MNWNEKNSYLIPRWCRMSPLDHFDGVGGCWGISAGGVMKHGRDYCRTCGFYSRNFEAVGKDELAAIGYGLGRIQYMEDRKAEHLTR